MNTSDLVLNKVKSVPSSGIRKYFDLINEMEDVISLGIGEPDFITPWSIREEGIYSLEKGHTHYSPNSGFLELREEISGYMKRRFGLSYDPKDEVIVTVGGSEAIDLALRCLIGKGDEVIIPEPCFVAYKPCTLFAGGTPVTINLREEDEFRLTPELLEKAITSATKLLILAYPNNPTGAIMTGKDLGAISEILRDKDILVLSDEIYGELTYGERHVSIASFPGMKDKTIIVSGFSKAFAMTGFRLGYATGDRSIISAMLKIHQYTIMSSPTMAQRAAVEALRNGEKDARMMVREYNRRRRVMVDGFRKAGYDCFEPLGAFYVFPCIKNSGLTSEEFCEKLLLEKKVLVVPGDAFGEGGEGFVRATYANSMENIIRALDRIREFSMENNFEGM